MGMGLLVDSTTIFKRKFRWGMTITPLCTKGNNTSIEEEFVKLASRPNITIEETEINMKNGRTWIPGKASWETITVTFYDVVGEAAGTGIMALYSWLASVYNFTEGIQGGPRGGNKNVAHMGSARSDYSAVINLRMYSGCGDTLEEWTLKDAWPQAINFGDLDYASSEEATIELTVRYSDVEYCSCAGEFDYCCDASC